MDKLLAALQGFGIGRLAAVLGAGAGAAAILVAILLKVGGAPMSLLYANLDLKEASQITSQLDQSGVKYEVKGDGSTIFVDRDKVASTRLLLSGKGLPTSGSVGYEIFDNAPALGQTDFVQNLDRQRALEGELARTIRSIQGVSFVRVHLVMPRRQLFEEDAEQPSASILIATGAGRIGGEQVRAIRNLVAGAVPDLKPERVSIADQQGELLAAEGDGAVDGGGERNQVEERIRRTVKDIVEGVVGPGHARVQVNADLDMASHTTQSEKFDPDGQVVRSTQTSDEKSNESKQNANGVVTASANIPGGTPSPSGSNGDSSNTGKQDETTNYEISKTTTTDVQAPGQVKRLSVAVAVDGTTAPAKGGKPGAYTPRSAEEMKRIDQLVRSAMGFDDKRGDQLSVVNVQFNRDLDGEGASVASAFAFDKNDIMRGAELLILAGVAGMIIFFVVKPMLKTAAAPGGALVTALSASPRFGPDGQPAVAGALGYEGGGALALPGPGGDAGIDIARIEGQVKASSVKRVAEFVDRYPDESIAILRSWLHES